MILFKTERLIIKSLEENDKEYFTELLTDPIILELIPQKPYNQQQINTRFNANLNISLNHLNKQKCVFGIFEKNKPALIGLALFLYNDKGEKELGYRFRSKYWRKGYGTETTIGMLDFYFNTLKVSKVVADVNIANIGSVKILEKFMTQIDEFYNENDKCTDRRYEIKKTNYLK